MNADLVHSGEALDAEVFRSSAAKDKLETLADNIKHFIIGLNNIVTQLPLIGFVGNQFRGSSTLLERRDPVPLRNIQITALANNDFEET